MGGEVSRGITADEIAALRAEGFGRDASARGRLLATIELLRRFTDEDEGLTANEIARVLGECSGKTPSENTVHDDLHAIAEVQPLGMELRVPSHGENVGFRCVHSQLSSDDAIVLDGMVRTSKFLGSDQREALCAKLEAFVSDRRQTEALEGMYVDERERGGVGSTLDLLADVTRAVQSGERVRFFLSYRQMDGEERLAGPFVEDPILVVHSFGYYYLATVTVSEEHPEGKLMYRRLDHLRKVVLTGQKVENPGRVEELRGEVIRSVPQLVDMYGDGTCRTLFLRVRGEYAGRVFDRFGGDVKFAHIDARDPRNVIGYACVRVQLSPTFYRWLFGMGDGVTLAKPLGRKWVASFGVCEADENLRSDYATATDGFRALLSAALENYRA